MVRLAALPARDPSDKASVYDSGNKDYSVMSNPEIVWAQTKVEHGLQATRFPQNERRKAKEKVNSLTLNPKSKIINHKP